MKKALVLIATLGLAGCAGSVGQANLITTKQVVVMPDQSLFHCPNVRKFPDPEKLTDVEVAKLLVNLHANNTMCQKNINSIHEFLVNSKKTAEKKKD
jgi:hypothetical protein